MGKYLVDQYICRIYKAGESCRKRAKVDSDGFDYEACIKKAMMKEFDKIKTETAFLSLPTYSQTLIAKCMELDEMNHYVKQRSRAIISSTVMIFLMILSLALFLLFQ